MSAVAAWTRGRTFTVVSWALLALGTWAFLITWPYRSYPVFYRIDADVYRVGAQVLLDGGDLYGSIPPIGMGLSLPFTYPPFAAVVFTVLTVLPRSLMFLLVGLSSVACLYYVVWATLGQVLRTARRVVAPARLATLSALVTALALGSGPVRETLAYGQVNLYLMALVVADVTLGRGRWWRGSLIGFAAALKLTPAVFVLLPAVRRDRRAVAGVVGSAAVLTGLAWLLAPSASTEYWFHALRDPARIGALGYPSNQSLQGALQRLDPDGQVSTPVWALGVLVVIVACVLVMRRLVAEGQPMAALCVNAMVGLVASPVSWGHHWVWAVPALLVAAGWITGWRARAAGRPGPGDGSPGDAVAVAGNAGALDARRKVRVLTTLVVTGLVVFYLTPYWLLPYREGENAHWSPLEQLAGDSVLWWGLACVAALWWCAPAAAARGAREAT